MRLPNKVNSYNESIISKFSTILSLLEKGDKQALSLFLDLRGKTDDVGDFVETLDCLYALGEIEYDKEKRSLHYVSRD